MIDSEPDVWLVTGSSTGSGRALAEAVLERGDALVATARAAAQVGDLAARDPGRVIAARLDVTEPSSVAEAVEMSISRFGRIDRVVNCAGTGLVGSIEEASREEVESVFETNMYGPLNVVGAALPHMRARRRGHIAVVTSQGAFQGQQGCGIYCASKAAVNSICEALAMEVAPLGIRVTIIEPGLVSSNFHAHIAASQRRIPDYEATCGPLRKGVAGPQPPSAHAVGSAARAIVTAMTDPLPPLNMPLGADALHLIRSKLAFVGNELDRWDDVARTVKSDPPPSAPVEEWGQMHWPGPASVPRT